jgi:hypothetical protein
MSDELAKSSRTGIGFELSIASLITVDITGWLVRGKAFYRRKSVTAQTLRCMSWLSAIVEVEFMPVMFNARSGQPTTPTIADRVRTPGERGNDHRRKPK